MCASHLEVALQQEVPGGKHGGVAEAKGERAVVEQGRVGLGVEQQQKRACYTNGTGNNEKGEFFSVYRY